MRNWLKDLMTKKPHSTKSLAEKISVSKRIVYFWLEGGEISIENRRKLAAEFGNKVIDRISEEDKAAAEQLKQTA